MRTRIGGVAGCCALAACGGDLFTAKIEGKAWAAEPITINAMAGGVPGGVNIVGAQNADGLNRALTMTLGNIQGLGTYWLGVSADTVGGIGLVGESGAEGSSAVSWITENTGMAGTITITQLDTRVVATFEYVAADEAGGTRSVTDGELDLPLAGTLPPVAEQLGNTLSAKIGGVLYNAASVSTARSGLTMEGLQVSSTTKLDGLSITIADAAAPGDLAIHRTSPIRIILAGKNGGDAMHCCWGNTDADSGKVVVTSITAKRAKGTFSGTLGPKPGSPATTPLEITDGVFDVGIR